MDVDTVKPDALPNGYCGLWQAGWFIDKNDSERWEGNYAMIPATPDLWVPSCELIDIEEIPSGEYYESEKQSRGYHE
jgi:hypothetical protein